MTTTEVTELLAALRDGRLTLDEVAQRFRERSWPRTRSPEPASYPEMAARAQQDPEPYVPGSIDEVAAAYDRGDLTWQQYRTLAAAVADAFRAEQAGDEEARNASGEPQPPGGGASPEG